MVWCRQLPSNRSSFRSFRLGPGLLPGSCTIYEGGPTVSTHRPRLLAGPGVDCLADIWPGRKGRTWIWWPVQTPLTVVRVPRPDKTPGADAPDHDLSRPGGGHTESCWP